MQRVLCVVFPTFSTDRLKRRERVRRRGALHAESAPALDQAFILLSRSDHGRELVAACCRDTARAGVRPGLPITEARAVLTGSSHPKHGSPERPVIVLPHRPDQDDRALHKLAEWASRYSPVVSADTCTGPFRGLIINMTGCTHLFGGEHRLVQRVSRDFGKLGYHTRISIACTPRCAWGVASFARHRLTCVPCGGERAALGPLPIAALGLEAAGLIALAEVGVTRVSELLALDRGPLASRLGMSALHRIDEALGKREQLLTPVQSTEPPQAERELAGSTDRPETIERIVQDLLLRLCRGLQGEQLGIRALNIILHRSDIAPLTISSIFARPTNDPQRLFKLLRPKLEKAHMGFGVDRITLIALHTQRLHIRQLAFTRPHTRLEEQAGQHTAGQAAGPSDTVLADALATLADTLSARLGPERLRHLFLRESHVCEAIPHWVPSTAIAMREPARVCLASAPRPSMLLHTPDQIQVLSHDFAARPQSLRWRRQVCNLVSLIGPERIAPPWWTEPSTSTSRFEAGSTRDYFAAQTSRGLWLWLFRTRSTQLEHWFVHGLWA